MNKGILIYIQINRKFEIEPVAFELTSKAIELSKKLGNEEVSAILIGDEIDYTTHIKSLSQAGFDNIYIAKHSDLKNYSTDNYSKIICDLIENIKPSIMLIGATTQGRDLAPRISSKLGVGLTADCTQLDINEKSQLASTRPTFGGNLMATILCKNYPQMASVRPNVLKKSPEIFEKNTKVEFLNVNFENSKRVELLEFIEEKALSDVNLSQAQIIVAGGRGLKTKEGFERIKELAKLLNAAPAASRGAVEMGLAPHSLQVGQTGKTVTPKIYIAFGISGAIQHTIGMSSSDKIISINTDSKAPIFNISDYKIVADAQEILSEWINLLKN